MTKYRPINKSIVSYGIKHCKVQTLLGQCLNARISFSVLLIALDILCFGQSKVDSNSYYFPFNHFLFEKTYFFVNKNDTSEKTDWKMISSVVKGDSIFQTTIYNGGKISEKIVETIQNGSSKIRTYTLYRNGNSSDCQVIDSLVYKIDQLPNEQIQWSVNFKDFESTNIISLTKTRRIESISVTKQTFIDNFTLHLIGTSNQYQYSLISVYEKGRGLIAYKLTRPNGQVKQFELVDVK